MRAVKTRLLLRLLAMRGIPIFNFYLLSIELIFDMTRWSYPRNSDQNDAPNSGGTEGSGRMGDGGSGSSGWDPSGDWVGCLGGGGGSSVDGVGVGPVDGVSDCHSHYYRKQR